MKINKKFYTLIFCIVIFSWINSSPIYSEIYSQEISLKKGWNLISLPLSPDDNYLFRLFPEAEVAYEYKNGSYINVEYLEVGKGYWVKMNADHLYIITGTPFSECLSCPQGEQGPAGEQGIPGPQGQQGSQGIQGIPGISGKNGSPPEHEWDNTSIRFKNPDNSWGKFVNLIGEKGEKGQDGNEGLAPDHEWLDKSLRFRKPDGSWGEFVNLSSETNQNSIIQAVSGEDINGAVNPTLVYYREDGVIFSQLSSGSNIDIFGVNTYAQTFKTDSSTKVINKVAIEVVHKNGEPSGNIVCSIFEYDMDNTKILQQVGVSSYSAANINNGWCIFNFSEQVQVKPLSYYAIKISLPNGNDTNYIKCSCINSNLYTDGLLLYSNDYGNTWQQDIQKELTFKIYSTNRVYKSSSNSIDSLYFIGFAISNAKVGEIIDIQISGLIDNFEELSVGNTYYLNGIGTIGVSPGKFITKVGIATDTNTLLLVKDSTNVGQIVSGDIAPPGYAVVEQYFVGNAIEQYCKKRVRGSCSSSCSTSMPDWVKNDQDCNVGNCYIACDNIAECTPQSYPNGWYQSNPTGVYFQQLSDRAGCGSPYYYRYQRVTSKAIWSRVVKKN